ncbi:MAG: hypothetical protein K6E54_04320 [Bacteroidaceae bacterium]|nr:hypothetical protein [Bacteroidaceae bacterium]
MKKIITYTALFLISFSSFAQIQTNGDPRENGPKKEFSQQMFKKALEEFVTKEANITPQEGEKFFPLLHEMMETQRKNKDQSRLLFKKLHSTNLSENEYEQIVKKSLELDIEDAKIQQTYYKKFHNILSWEKICKVRHSLTKFHMELLKSFSPNKKGPRFNFMPMPGNKDRKGARP